MRRVKWEKNPSEFLRFSFFCTNLTSIRVKEVLPMMVDLQPHPQPHQSHPKCMNWISKSRTSRVVPCFKIISGFCISRDWTYFLPPRPLKVTFWQFKFVEKMTQCLHLHSPSLPVMAAVIFQSYLLFKIFNFLNKLLCLFSFLTIGPDRPDGLIIDNYLCCDLISCPQQKTSTSSQLDWSSLLHLLENLAENQENNKQSRKKEWRSNFKNTKDS